MSAAPLTDAERGHGSLVPGPDTGDFVWRVLRLLNVFRIFIASILTLTFVLIDEPRIVGEVEPALAAATLGLMIVVALIEIPLLHRGWPAAATQIYLTFAFDLAAVTALTHASGGIESGFAGLLIVSVGSLALLLPARQSFSLAAIAALVLLGAQTIATVRGISSSAAFAPTGILGAVIFVITGIVQLLRDRMVQTEALAAQRGVDLQDLVELNDYIIQHLRESIVVVDGENRIRLINESAARLLAAPIPANGTELDAVSPVLTLYLDRWRAHRQERRRSARIPLPGDEGESSYQPHFARLGSGRDEGVIIFLEDTSLLQERVQQTKLAALGRLSASIAHEIRNPLGALSHASQLLAEDEQLGASGKRLTDIIRVNSQRVSQIVESVMALSRSDRVEPETIDLKRWATDFAAEFVETQELYEGTVSVDPASVEIEAEMDRTHLHQVVWNLCDNAVKYASKAAGAIAVELRCGILESTGRPFLEVADRGPGVDAEKIEQIFEPFYTGQPGGTGLGLYISRELCERNGAMLRYHPRPEGGSVFRVVFADPQRWQARDQ